MLRASTTAEEARVDVSQMMRDAQDELKANLQTRLARQLAEMTPSDSKSLIVDAAVEVAKLALDEIDARLGCRAAQIRTAQAAKAGGVTRETDTALQSLSRQASAMRADAESGACADAQMTLLNAMNGMSLLTEKAAGVRRRACATCWAFVPRRKRPP